ncbi:MAG: hypothetical protein LBK67_05380, partial [Coriobacteriales bacterium]|nr:hypothetical protein [Coriobacteriales bacterium]
MAVWWYDDDVQRHAALTLIGALSGLCSPAYILLPISTPPFANMIDVAKVYFVKQTILDNGEYV